MTKTVVGLQICAALALTGGMVGAHEEHEVEDGGQLRAAAARRVTWRSDDLRGEAKGDKFLRVKLLGINDFHGQLSPRTVSGRPAGGAAVLAAYLEAAMAGMEDQSLIVHAGDQVGASPPNSALLQDEPAISFLNSLANRFCSFREDPEDAEEDSGNPQCNLVGTLGNHEFDEGRQELFRLVFGGNHPTGPFLESPWRGAKFPYVSSNVVVARTGHSLLSPYVIRRFHARPGIPIGVVGAVLKDTPSIVTPTGVAGLQFLDEADAINQAVGELKERGVRAIVVAIHQGGTQRSFTGGTSNGSSPVSGQILDIVSRLDDEVDVVVSGHTHAFTNALVPNQHGKPILVVQAFSASTAYDDIDLTLDAETGDVVEKSARVVTTFGDAGPGLSPDARIAQMVAEADARVAPLVNRVIGTATADITRAENAAGESALGNLIADAQRASLGTDFAFMNPGGIRDELRAGTVTWGKLFAVQPFGNSLVKMKLTGQRIYDLLEQQFQGQPFPRILKTSGLTYTWDASRPLGSRIVEVRKDGQAIDRAATFTVTVNNFMAGGGDNFTTLLNGTEQVGGPIDLDALVEYVGSLAQPFSASIEGRITRRN